MKPNIIINFLPLVALAAFSSGCGTITLSPELPALHISRDDATETSKLVTIFNDPTGYREIWVVYVDGIARTWLPAQQQGFTRVPVTPGHHEVTLELRGRHLPVIFVPLLPESYESQARIRVTCQEHSMCGLKVSILIDSHQGRTVDAATMKAEELEKEISQLPLLESHNQSDH